MTFSITESQSQEELVASLTELVKIISKADKSHTQELPTAGETTESPVKI